MEPRGRSLRPWTLERHDPRKNLKPPPNFYPISRRTNFHSNSCPLSSRHLGRYLAALLVADAN